ncbi:MAG: hypothetical protein H6581_16340 [Bacteroidia bacterium]|nr:hypothetical protein [Bacteroidia bacterium]
MKKLLVITLFLLASNYSKAQTIIGTVIDGKTADPLAGTLVKSGSKGVITDSIGGFILSINRGESLEFTFIGFPKHEIVDINLEKDTVNIGSIELSSVGAYGYVMYEKKRFLSKKTKYVCRRIKIKNKDEKDGLIVRCPDGQIRYTWTLNDEKTLQVEFDQIKTCTFQ